MRTGIQQRAAKDFCRSQGSSRMYIIQRCGKVFAAAVFGLIKAASGSLEIIFF